MLAFLEWPVDRSIINLNLQNLTTPDELLRRVIDIKGFKSFAVLFRAFIPGVKRKHNLDRISEAF